MRETYYLFLNAAESGQRDRPLDEEIARYFGFVVLAKRALVSVSYILSQYLLNYQHDRRQRPPHRKSRKLLISRNNTFFSQLILAERLVKRVC